MFYLAAVITMTWSLKMLPRTRVGK